MVRNPFRSSEFVQTASFVIGMVVIIAGSISVGCAGIKRPNAPEILGDYDVMAGIITIGVGALFLVNGTLIGILNKK